MLLNTHRRGAFGWVAHTRGAETRPVQAGESADRPGSAPDARHYFLLSCQKKVSKENARPQRRPAAPVPLRCSVATGGCGTRTFGPQTVLAPFSVAPCAARRRKGQIENHLAIDHPLPHQAPFGVPRPSCSAEQRRRAGGSRRGLSEGRGPEFRSRPACRVAQGSRHSRPRNAGVAFSLATFFWRPKRKYARASGAEHSVSAAPSTSRTRPFKAEALPYRQDSPPPQPAAATAPSPACAAPCTQPPRPSRASSSTRPWPSR